MQHSYSFLRNMGMKKTFAQIIRRKIAVYLLLILIMLVAAALSVVCSQIMVYVVDNLTDSVIIDKLIVGLLIYFVVSVIQNMMGYFQTILITHLNEQVGIEVKEKIVDCLFDKPLSYFNEHKAGDLQQVLLGDVLKVTSFFTDTVLSITSNALMAIAIIIYLACLQWDLLLIVLALQPVTMIIQSFFGKKVYEISDAYRDAIGDAASFSQEIITNSIQYIALGLRRFCLGKYKIFQKDSAYKSIKSSGITKLSATSISCVSVIIFVLIFGFGGYKVSVGTMSIGMLIAFIQFSQNLLDPFLELFSIKIEYEQIKPSMQRIENVVDSDTVQLGCICSGIEGNIEFRNVTFSYSESEPVLSDISASFKKGKTYCIVGKSGSGKTTICNLILRLCHPQQGQILIDGIPINRFDEEYFRKSITYIAQVPFVFNGTIKENICLDQEISKDHLYEAVVFSGLAEDLQKFPDHESHLTGDGGANLSVGQRQRIGLTRAYIRNSPIVIFDEPTASIGQEYTKWFIAQLESYKQDRLVIIISHDEAVADCCDIVYGLNDQGSLKNITGIKNS